MLNRLSRFNSQIPLFHNATNTRMANLFTKITQLANNSQEFL